MNRILLVDHDSVFIETTEASLREAGYQVIVESTGEGALKRVTDVHPDVAVIALELADMPGMDILRELRVRTPRTACAMVAALPRFKSVIEALRLGACDYIKKPVAADDLLAAVQKALDSPARLESRRIAFEACEPHPLTGWRDAVLAFVASPSDAKNLPEFGHAVRIAPTRFRHWCRILSLSPSCSLHFARALRAVARQSDVTTTPQNLLKIVDLRTLVKFVRASGGTGRSLPVTVGEFLERQEFIRNARVLATVRAGFGELAARDGKTGTAMMVSPDEHAPWLGSGDECATSRGGRRDLRNCGATVLLTGTPGPAKAAIATRLCEHLHRHFGLVLLLDADRPPQAPARSRYPRPSEEAWSANLRYVAVAAAKVTRLCGVAVCCVSTPAAAARRRIRQVVEPLGEFVPVHVLTYSQRRVLGHEQHEREYADDMATTSDLNDVPGDVALVINPSTIGTEQASSGICDEVVARCSSSYAGRTTGVRQRMLRTHSSGSHPAERYTLNDRLKA